VLRRDRFYDDRASVEEHRDSLRRRRYGMLIVGALFVMRLNSFAWGIVNSVVHPLAAELPKLAVDFFIVFTRFECALKRPGSDN
jgi:hypothetical protein